ncbi:MAG TPA: A/G-specific adenine glycosylase [Phycisphaerales bacterium]|nr:A/G-specific adenine glycosylase [Phycisphaerales bacterium]
MRNRTRSRDGRDEAIVRRLVEWFEKSARELPWRKPARGASAEQGARRDPYVAFVAEIMLQQTQAGRVAERLGGFVRRFGSVRALAKASEQDVLAAWSGLGYYRRARNLHAAARLMVERFGGKVPHGVEELMSLPGVGRYTAGSIASIVYGKAAPIVDGNVERVLMRVEGKELAREDPKTRAWTWGRAEELVTIAAERGGAGEFNEAMMELGAVVCVPRSPRCGECPLRELCVARREGLQETIPLPKKRAAVSEVRHDVIVIRRRDGAVLMRQRGDDGLWAGMWEAITHESPGTKGATREELVNWSGAIEVNEIETFTHQTTHRRVTFRVWEGRVGTTFRPEMGEFVDPRRMTELPMSNPQRRVIERWAAGGPSARAEGSI